MKRFFQILSNHKWAIIFAVLIGLIIALPHPYFRFEHRDVYQGIGLSEADEETYLTRIQEVRDGHFTIANPVWAEGKNLPYLFPPLSENITSFVGQIFGLDLIDTITLGRFIFPAFIFLLIYALLCQLTKRKSIALVVSTAVLLSTDLVNPQAVWNLFFNQEEIYHNFLPFSRLVSPQVHLIFFFGFLLLFWFFLQKRKWSYGISSGIVLGLSFYAYPYNWTSLFAFLGCLVFIFVWKKEWLKVKNIILMAGLALLVALPYFWNLWQAMQHPLYSEVALRFGLLKTHLPQAGALVLILLAVFLLFFSRQWKERYYFCLGLVLTPLVVLNQQIITGIRVMQPGHYHWFYHKPLAVIIIIIIIFELLERRISRSFIKKIIWSSLIGFILFVSFYNAWRVQSSSYLNQEQALIENQRYGFLFKWLNDNSQKDQVALADEHVSYKVTVYTHLNSVNRPDGHYTLTADRQEMMERIFLTYRFDGLKAEDAKRYFFENRDNISAWLWGVRFRDVEGEDYGNITVEELRIWINMYKEFLKVPLKDVLEKYQVDYLIWDTVRHPEWQIEQYLFFEQIYQVDRFKIFKLL